MNSEIIFNSFQAEANLSRYYLEPTSDQELQDGTEEPNEISEPQGWKEHNLNQWEQWKSEANKTSRVCTSQEARASQNWKIVRFMYYEADDTAAYWMQGKLAHRLDKYKVAKASN